MATWRDGPEYAPSERPAEFVSAPQVGPLTSAPVPAAPRPGPPPGFDATEPAFTPPQADLPDLAALVPSAAPGRNPRVPFEVSTAALAPGSAAWSGPRGPHRPPEQPFPSAWPPVAGYLPPVAAVQPTAQVNPAPFPAPGTPQWFSPPPHTQVPPPPPPPVTLGQIWTASTPGVLVPLLIGAVFGWLSIFMLAISFAASARIAYRREAVRRSYLVGTLLVLVAGSSAILADTISGDLLFEALSTGAQMACLALPVAISLIVGSAIRAGERPDRLG